MTRSPERFLTAIVPTFNEEANIRDCLASLSFADEILVVDSFSTDRTVELARSVPKVRVLQHAYEGNGPQCNWAMDQASHPWILIVDADERVTQPLASEIEALLAAGPPADLYRLRRENIFLGRPLRGSGWGRDRLVRLLRRFNQLLGGFSVRSRWLERQEFFEHGDSLWNRVRCTKVRNA